MTKIVGESISSKSHEYDLWEYMLGSITKCFAEILENERLGYQVTVQRLQEKLRDVENQLADYEQELYEKDQYINKLQTEKLAETNLVKTIQKIFMGLV